MDRPLLRRALAMLALCAAAAVCVQVGVIHIARRDRNLTLEDELATLRESRARELGDLRRQLERAERSVSRLRRELAHAEAASSELENVIRDAETSHDRLRTKLGNVAETLGSERPALDVHLAPLDTPNILAATAENRGTQPLAIAESHGWFWVNGEPLALIGSLAPLRVEPGAEVDVFEWDPAAHALELVPGSDVPVRGAFCFVYGRATGGETTPWVEERWFEYRPASGSTATLRHDSWPLDADAAGCDLENAEPPW